MRRPLALATLATAAALLAGCGGPQSARLKGRVLGADGQPFTLQKGDQGFMRLLGKAAAGTKGEDPEYPAMLNPDGTFEVVASGGELKPGTYRVALEVVATTRTTKEGRPVQEDRLKGRFKADKTTLSVEAKAGPNDVTVTLPPG